MGFDSHKMAETAKVLDVSGVAIDTVRAIQNTAKALRKIEEKIGIDISAEIQELWDNASSINKKFDKITGWTPE